jgi:hypothetical protein
MNLGAFAGGMAQGISQGIRNVRDYQRAQHEDKQIQDEDAWKKETEDLYKRFSQAAQPQQQAEQQPTGQVDQQQQQPAAPTSPAAQPQQATEQQQAQKPVPPKEFGSVADAMDFAVESSKINMKYGKASPMDLVKLKMMSDQFEREGMDTAIGLLHGGDVQGALRAYNQSGRDRVTFKGEPVQGTYEYAGQKIPTMIATVVGADGRERQVNTAQIMTSKMGVEKQLNALMDFAKFDATVDHQNDTLNEQRRHNIATEGIASMSKEDRRGTVGKDYDDLAGIYGPEQAAQMVGGKYGKKEVTDYQRIQALDKIQGIIDIDGGVNDKNVAQVNAMLRSIGEPAYERVIDQPEEINRVFPNKAATYKYVPGTRVETDGPGQGLQTPVGPAGGLGANNNVGGMRPEGKSTGFQSFGSVEESLKAVDQNIKAYKDLHGINTIDGLISRWSPEKDGNNTQKLIDDASRVTGFKRGQKIDLGNPAVRAVVAAAIIRQEGNSAFLSGVGDRGPAGGLGKTSGNNVGNVKDGPVAAGESKNYDFSKFDTRKQQQQTASVVKNGINGGKTEKPWYEKEVDVGAAVGKPLAAIGESVGKSVAGTVNALAAIKNTLTEAEYQKALAYAQAQNVDIGPMIKQLGVDGFKAWLSSANPARNTEKYMQRTSSNNLNQYFR